MSDFTFNCALGREAEFHWRVKNNDPANAVLKLLVLAASGLESDAALKDYDTVAAILGGASNEVTNTNYARISLADAALTAWTVDDTNDRIVLPLDTQTFTNIAAGDYWSKLITSIDMDSTTGDDTNIIPISAHDLRYSGLPVVPNGTNIVIGFPNGYVVCD